MSKINVRRMDIEDIDSVLEIEHLCFPSPWTRESFIREIQTNMLAKYLVIELHGRIVGYGGMWFIVDEAHITNIAIHPKYRERGLGSYLVKSMIEYTKNLGIYRMTLEVRKSNLTAQRLYEKFNFKSAGIRPKYYNNQEDAVIMWREE